ncbi:MAG: glycosyltransferase family 4 protein [Eudoraea sp.]|nr:glycosyltransferase family 4 protein [Eudoraea sp.]NNK30181.1 glycosyltransferase family 4 protein [Flavobacteriaceae bacterium]
MRKVLIITYYWPPSGGPGVQRWLKFAKYLREFDVEPIIYTPSNPDYPITDPVLTDEVPDGLKIYRRPIIEPYRFAGWFSRKNTDRIRSGIIPDKRQSAMDRFLLWIRGNLFIPDARKLWVKPSIGYLRKLIDQEQPQAIITTGPPHSMHLIGLGLKKYFPIPWFADFRDPWTNIGYHNQLRLSAFAKKKHLRLEQRVLNTADVIIVTSETTKKEFKGLTQRPIEVITNGYDTGYENPEPLDKRFTISHIGSLLSKRNPTNLWQVLGELLSENAQFRDRFTLQLIGVVGREVLDSIESFGLKANTQVLEYVPHDKAVQYQKQAQVLLLAEINTPETRGIVPGKLFEYLAARRPILGIGPEEWEAGVIIKRTHSGCAFDYQADSELKKVILDWFQKYLSDSLDVKDAQIAQYSRRELTRNLAKLLHGNRF